jgi:hypothetical protein
MDTMILGLTSRVVDGPLAPSVAAFSFVASLVLTAGVGWLASHVTREREQRRLEQLAEATPVAGVH